MREDVQDVVEIHDTQIALFRTAVLSVVLVLGLAWSCGYEFQRSLWNLALFFGWVMSWAAMTVCWQAWYDFVREKTKARNY